MIGRRAGGSEGGSVRENNKGRMGSFLVGWVFSTPLGWVRQGKRKGGRERGRVRRREGRKEVVMCLLCLYAVVAVVSGWLVVVVWGARTH